MEGVYLGLIELEFAKVKTMQINYFKLFYTINVHVKKIMIIIRQRKHPLVLTRNLEERSQLEEGNFPRKKSQQAKIPALLLWKII